MIDYDVVIITKSDGTVEILVGSYVPYSHPIDEGHIKFRASIPKGGLLILRTETEKILNDQTQSL